MSSMTNVTAAESVWTLAATATAGQSILIENRDPATPLKVRVDAGALVGDALTAPHIVLAPGARHLFAALALNDKLFVSPVGSDAVLTLIWG